MNIKLLPEAEMPMLEREQLRSKLDKYYGTVSDYLAFASTSKQVECWAHIENEIQRISKEKSGKKIMILEIGAGMSGFGEWLKARDLRNIVHWTTQDVTVVNEPWLKSQADNAIYGDISELQALSSYDIVFSTYVLEHVTNPQQHLNFAYSLLKDAGKFFVFCPRYDLPGYLCPSTRHLNSSIRLLFGAKLILSRLRSFFTRQPAFLIQTDLAAFYRPFFLDADAVHWASVLDLKLWAKRKGARFRMLKVGKPKFGSKDWFVKRLLTCAVEIQK